MSGFSCRAVNCSSILGRGRSIYILKMWLFVQYFCSGSKQRAASSPVSTEDQGSLQAGESTQLWEQKTHRKPIAHNLKVKVALQGYAEQTSLVNLMVCRASSLVGVMMMALAPVLAWGAFSRSNMGTRKAAVLPLPVLAMATMSLPSKITGMV